MGSHRKFARRFAKGIRKLVGNMKGDHRKKIGGLTARMPEATGLTEVGSKLSLWSLSVVIVESYEWWLDRSYHRIWATTNSFLWVNRPGGG
ncbi:hypothetical protein BHM03_00059302 [Ensete ventricosum]|nr:hypothetical protein BHM03_00059302 [Ensete ventricosum]